ncbi:MAG: transposase [Patescibacteria group bacterium]|jgi:REP element-mobilizing transposase RayT|nr:transposase [Patescibacteria group bacterium]
MSTRNRISIPNETYFITFTILGWKNIFVQDKYFDLIYRWFDYVKEKYNNTIYSYVIMPNHIHLLIKISAKSPTLSVLIMNAKRFLAYDIVKFLKEDNKSEFLDFFNQNARKNVGAKHKLFENRFDSLIIQSEKFFLEKLNYIHKNPCNKHWRLADSPENFKHSSASNYTLGKGHYDIDVMDI